MRNIVFLMCLLLTQFSYAQNNNESGEVQQKIRKVEERRSNTNSFTNPNTNPNTNYNYQRPNSYYGPYYNRPVTPYYYSPYQWGCTPYWNPNRTWSRKSYVMTTDESLLRSNTQKPPIRFSLGLLTEADHELITFSPYLTIGRKNFMIMQYHFTVVEQYPYYNNIQTWEVMQWEDEYQGQTRTKGEFAIGMGTSVERLSPFIMIGFPTTRTYDNYFDETYILSSPSNGGIYSINEDKQTNISLRGGMIYQLEYLELIGQLRYDGNIGVGFGVGLKL